MKLALLLLAAAPPKGDIFERTMHALPIRGVVIATVLILIGLSILSWVIIAYKSFALAAAAMKSLANEYAAQGIRVNSIAPGWTLTDRIKDIFQNRSQRGGTTYEQEAAKVIAQIPIGRIADPNEFADALVWLASPRASYITGILLPIDGGLTQSYL